MTLEIHHHRPLAQLNTLGLQVNAEHFADVRSEDEVRAALLLARDHEWRVTILGGGSNVVFRGDIEGLVLRVRVPGIDFDGDRVDAGAGELWHRLVLASIEEGLAGLENLALIPGSVGAAPIQNIGAYGVELDAVFDSVTAIDRHSFDTITLGKTDCEFSYRDSVFKGQARDRYVITRVRLNLSRHFVPNLAYAELQRELKETGVQLSAAAVAEAVCRIRTRKLPDPGVTGNVGSFFKNPVVSWERHEELVKAFPGIPSWRTGHGVKLAAGWLIDQCGLKGSRVGDAAISRQHALVIVNQGMATGPDILALADHVIAAVQDRFDLRLEVEPVIC